VCPWKRGGIGVFSQHYCSTTPVHGGPAYESLCTSVIVFIVRFIRFWNNVWVLRFLCGEYEDYIYLGCDAVCFGGCQFLGGCSAIGPHLPDYKLFHPKRSSNAEYRRIRGAVVKSFSWNNDITSVAVLCPILSHELSKLGSNRASCLGGLGFEPRPGDGQGFRIYCLLQQKCWGSYFI